MKIRQSITLWVAGAGLVSSIFLSLVAFFEMQEQPYKLIDSELSLTASYLEQILVDTGRPREEQRAERLLTLLGDRYWAKVFDRRGQLVYRSELTTQVNLPFRQDSVDARYTLKAPMVRDGVARGAPLAFRARTVAAGPYRVEIATPMQNLAQEERELAIALGLGFAASTVLLVVLSYLVAGRIVKPLGVINVMTREITEKTLATRLPLGKSQDEIYELTRSLNRMFDRLQHSFVRQKEFLANASHELKTPIAMLRLFFDEMMQRPDLPEALQEQIASQNEVTLRMERLVKNLLELSVLELKEELDLEPFDLASLCRSVLDDFSPLISERQLTLTSTLPATLLILADQDKIRRLLINILDNAIKYNSELGTVRLEMDQEKDSVRLLIANTFPPIPPHELEKVFDQFYRLEKSRSFEHGGAGLGLAIVKEIVRLHGGAISMESGPGAWVFLRVMLPIKENLRLDR